MAAVTESLKGRHFTRVADWSGEELLQALDLADDLKERQSRREEHHLLPGRTLGMIFQKPSTRTRVSFEVGIFQLGGMGLYLAASDLQLGRGETGEEIAEAVLYGPQSSVWDQAENRLHAQKAPMALVIS